MLIPLSVPRFTPDFTQSRASSSLRVATSDGAELVFPLLVFLPHHMLAACYEAQPRADWERQLARLSVPFWLASLLLLLVVAVLRSSCRRDGRGALRWGQPAGVDQTHQPTGGPLFNLNDISCSVHSTRAEKIATQKTR